MQPVRASKLTFLSKSSPKVTGLMIRKMLSSCSKFQMKSASQWIRSPNFTTPNSTMVDYLTGNWRWEMLRLEAHLSKAKGTNSSARATKCSFCSCLMRTQYWRISSSWKWHKFQLMSSTNILFLWSSKRYWLRLPQTPPFPLKMPCRSILSSAAICTVTRSRC